MSLTELQLRPFADFIKREIGIVYESQNYFQLEQRLERIAKILGLESAAEVCSQQTRVGISGPLRHLLLDIATNNETQFFRDPKVYKALAENVLPNLKTVFKSASSFKIWSTASSFGQEPYSLSIMVDEFLANQPPHPRFEILATDVSDTALKRSAEGKYSQLEVQRGMSAPRLVKYFEKSENDTWSVKRELRGRIKFERFNLLDPVPAEREAHLILCRYVLIYQEHAKKVEIMSRLARALLTGGYFVLGASESGLGLCDALEQKEYDGCIIYRKK
jgi:chemotaxis protein methyltransferase CheR